MKNTIVSFHIGRGGSFWNAGHRSYRGVETIQEVVNIISDKHWLFAGYENQNDILGDLDKDIRDKAIDLMSEVGQDDKLEDLGINVEDLGQHGLLDTNGSFMISDEDLESGVGTLNFDNDYDTYYTKHLQDCDVNELKLIADSRDADILEELEVEIFEIKDEEGNVTGYTYEPDGYEYESKTEAIIGYYES